MTKKQPTPPAANNRILEIAKNVIRLEEERKTAAQGIKEAYAAAKAEGFTPKALRGAIRIASMPADKRAKHDADQLDLETYLAAIDGVVAE